MSILQLSDVRLNPGGRTVFRGLDWRVQPRERSGLVGANGCGKSSLLRVMAGLTPVDEGSVSLQRGKRVGYLPQDLEFDDERSVLEVATVPPPDLVEVEALLAELEARLAEPAVYRDEERMSRVLARQDRALTRYAELGGPSYAGRVRALLLRFGFAEADWQPATAAQYFHLLRRQVLRPWRKPLVVFTPKGLLRAKSASSPLRDFTHDDFHSVRIESDRKDAERILVCTGKICHDLAAVRDDLDPNTAIVSLAQLFP